MLAASARASRFAVALVSLFSLTACTSQMESLTGATASATSSMTRLISGPTGQARLVPILSASTRKSEKSNSSDGDIHYALNMISVPPGHSSGTVELPSYGKANPKNHFVLASQNEIDENEFKNTLATNISGRVGQNRDVLIFVHGFNTSVEEARNRLAQVMVDGHFGGVGVVFTWPSEGALLAYESDKERATASRDALEQTLGDIAATPGVGRVHVLAHSMGTWLAMEALRQHAIAGHVGLDGHLGEVMLAAPDIDIDVFRQQMARVGKTAKVSVFASAVDRALTISSKIAGDRQRLGTLDLKDDSARAQIEKLGVKIYDITENATGFIHHDTFAEAPAVVAVIGQKIGSTTDFQTQATLDYAPPIPVDTSSPNR